MLYLLHLASLNCEPGKEDSFNSCVINATQLPPNNAQVKDHLLEELHLIIIILPLPGKGGEQQK